MAKRNIKFAPKEIFEEMLEWGVMPTFDLVIECGDDGIIIVRRNIAPYKNQWALPGLRQFKGERFRDTLVRIAKEEVGVNINPNNATILGQYDGFFRTKNNRQDISTGYHVSVDENSEIIINQEHFSSLRLIQGPKEIPSNTGAMYLFYLNKVFGVS